MAIEGSLTATSQRVRRSTTVIGNTSFQSLVDLCAAT